MIKKIITGIVCLNLVVIPVKTVVAKENKPKKININIDISQVISPLKKEIAALKQRVRVLEAIIIEQRRERITKL